MKAGQRNEEAEAAKARSTVEIESPRHPSAGRSELAVPVSARCSDHLMHAYPTPPAMKVPQRQDSPEENTVVMQEGAIPDLGPDPPSRTGCWARSTASCTWTWA
jgi:hypothetical protein